MREVRVRERFKSEKEVIREEVMARVRAYLLLLLVDAELADAAEHVAPARLGLQLLALLRRLVRVRA